MVTMNGKPCDGHSGRTIAQLLQALKYDFPLVYVRLNGQVVPQSSWKRTRIPEEARIEIYPVVAGG